MVNEKQWEASEEVERMRRVASHRSVSITTRRSFDEALLEHGLTIMDVLYALRNCDKVSGDFAAWPCVDYHGWSLDGERLVVVAVIHEMEVRIRLIKAWKEA